MADSEKKLEGNRKKLIENMKIRLSQPTCPLVTLIAPTRPGAPVGEDGAFYLPLFPTIPVKELIPESTNIFKSAKQPIALYFRMADGTKRGVMFKHRM